MSHAVEPQHAGTVKVQDGTPIPLMRGDYMSSAVEKSTVAVMKFGPTVFLKVVKNLILGSPTLEQMLTIDNVLMYII